MSGVMRISKAGSACESAITRIVRRATLGMLAGIALALSIGPGIAAAGTNGQQIYIYDLVSPQQSSVQVCGTNQNNNYVCHSWPTPTSTTELSGWWWVGPVTINNYDANGNLLGQTSCDVPKAQSSNWYPCPGWPPFYCVVGPGGNCPPPPLSSDALLAQPRDPKEG